jgi:hypothetical protein
MSHSLTWIVQPISGFGQHLDLGNLYDAFFVLYLDGQVHQGKAN